MKEIPTDHTIRVVIHLGCMLTISVLIGFLLHSILIGAVAFFILMHFYVD